MDVAIGSMHLGLARFTATWALMMSAMMLPTVAVELPRVRSAAVYIAAWTAVGIAVYAPLRIVDVTVSGSSGAVRVLAGCVFVGAGCYQLSPLKRRSLDQCREAATVGSANQYARACMVSSFGLMSLLFAVGLMQLGAMLLIAAVVFGERVLPHGAEIARVTGIACLLAGILALSSPSIARHFAPYSTRAEPMGVLSTP
jgi:predicted metal-binding membrane protein